MLGKLLKQKLVRWTLLGLLVFLMFKGISGGFTERIYGQGFFPLWRAALDVVHNILPISIFWIFIILIIIVWTRRKRQRLTLKRALKSTWILCMVLVVAFYVFWGFNYKRPGLSARLGLTPIDMDSTALQDLFYEQVGHLILLEQSRSDTSIHSFQYLDTLRSSVEQALHAANYPITGKAVIRPFARGVLLRWGTAGFYNPWIGEGYIDPGLHPLQKPFIIAHELTHAYGVTDEGEANVYALISGIQNEEPFINYTTRLTFLRYILSDLYAYPSLYAQAIEDIPPFVKEDIRSIRKQMAKYPDLMPAVRDFIYGSYLKTQGVRSGLKSYNEITRNYYALQKSSHPILSD